MCQPSFKGCLPHIDPACFAAGGGWREEGADSVLTNNSRQGWRTLQKQLPVWSITASFPAVPHFCSTSERPCLPEGRAQELGHWQPPSCRNCQGVPQEWLAGTHLHRPKNLPEVPASRKVTLKTQPVTPVPLGSTSTHTPHELCKGRLPLTRNTFFDFNTNENLT